MKRFFSRYIVLSIACILSCSKVSVIENDNGHTLRRSVTNPEVVIDSTFLVLPSDVERYAQRQQLSKGKVWQTVIPIDYSGFPVGYLVEYENGWEIISADRRGPIYLADCGEGNYDPSCFPDAAIDWMDYLYQSIADRWQQNIPLNENNENEVASFSFWEAITSIPTVETKHNYPPLILGELISSEVYSEEYEEIPHLTTSLWKQESPYNNACPFISSIGSSRALAGCGPVAVGQFLFYLHYFWGTPVYAPVYAICTDVLPNQTIQSSGPVSAGTWSFMNNSDSVSVNQAYKLIADIGMRSNTLYDATGSTSSFTSLIESMEDYQIGGEMEPYQIDTVVNYLHNDLPVLMRGGHSTSDGGHFFLIDGYVLFRDKYVDTYLMYSVDPGDGSFIPCPTIEQYVYYSTPYIQLLKMNWGWGAGVWHSTRYALSGVWEAGGHSYDAGMYMMCNLSTINNE